MRSAEASFATGSLTDAMGAMMGAMPSAGMRAPAPTNRGRTPSSGFGNMAYESMLELERSNAKKYAARRQATPLQRANACNARRSVQPALLERGRDRPGIPASPHPRHRLRKMWRRLDKCNMHRGYAACNNVRCTCHMMGTTHPAIRSAWRRRRVPAAARNKLKRRSALASESRAECQVVAPIPCWWAGLPPCNHHCASQCRRALVSLVPLVPNKYRT
jgi:hypothetical protein